MHTNAYKDLCIDSTTVTNKIFEEGIYLELINVYWTMLSKISWFVSSMQNTENKDIFR